MAEAHISAAMTITGGIAGKDKYVVNKLYHIHKLWAKHRAAQGASTVPLTPRWKTHADAGTVLVTEMKGIAISDAGP